MLSIKSLGNFDILLDGISLLEGNEVRRGLFLVYLAEQRKPQPRLEVARLFWPGVEDTKAQGNLRALLLRLRKEGLENFIEADRSSVALVNREAVEYDVARLRLLTTNVNQASLEDLIEAAELYQGGFLQAVAVDNLVELDEWVSAVRIEMEIRAVRAMSVLVSRAIKLGKAELVLHYAEELVSLTPYEDKSQELYMQALASTGRMADALNHFHQYRRRLKAETETDQVGHSLIELAAHLTRSRFDDDAVQNEEAKQEQSAFAASDQRQSNDSAINGEMEDSKYRFPHIEHRLVGRSDETSQMLSILDSGSRLITVLGIGGTGKTFFVRSLYEHLHTRFGKEIYYADLRSNTQSVQEANDALLFAIATRVNLTIQPGKLIFDQVVEYLRNRKCCLILDNFETVQSAALCVLDLLKATPQLTVLVTSRERLALSIESTLVLGGLSRAKSKSRVDSVSIPNHTNGNIDSDATQYFVECLQRRNVYYSINPQDRYWIEKICSAVAGLPLAIELTAMQVPFYGLSELAERIGTDRSLLAGDFGDLPGDHYSVWAVLDSMWQTLDQDARRVLTELSVFSGAFHREAMMAVSPALRNVYSKLINASLLRVEEPAWFSLHPLVKQYATHKLAVDTEARQRHAHYFLNWFGGRVRMRESFVYGAGGAPMPPLGVRCQADILHAWQWAVSHAVWDLIDQTQVNFAGYLELLRQEQELVRKTSQVLEHLPCIEEREPIHHRLAGRSAHILGLYASLLPDTPAQLWYERGMAWFEAADDAWGITAIVLSYVDQLIEHQTGSWDRVESLLSLANHQIETHHLDQLRAGFRFTACVYFLHQGQWENLRNTQKALMDATSSPAYYTGITGYLLYAAFLDNWPLVSWLLDRVEIDNPDTVIREHVKQWSDHYLADALAQSGDIQAAITLRLSRLDGYHGYTDRGATLMLPMAYGELALWQFMLGDPVAAQVSATQALVYAEQNLNSTATGFGQTFAAVLNYLNGNTADALPILHSVIERGQQLHHIAMVFSALYYLAQIHADQLPADLVERILKIGAVSPAMHFVLRPLARQHLAAQGVVIADEERATLWATDMKTVQALVDEVMKRIA